MMENQKLFQVTINVPKDMDKEISKLSELLNKVGIENEIDLFRNRIIMQYWYEQSKYSYDFTNSNIINEFYDEELIKKPHLQAYVDWAKKQDGYVVYEDILIKKTTIYALPLTILE
jgi:hypothetical protein